MTCRDVDGLIEALAVEEAEEHAAVQAHLAACPGCAGAFALARRIDALLRVRQAPEPPQAFTAQVVSRLRRERWRSEQRLDRAFNVLVVSAAALVAIGLWMLLNVSGMAGVTSEVSRVLGAGFDVARQRLSPMLPTYMGATLLLFTAVILWWWAERSRSL
jgi:anti-sigma factor RsiW